MKKINLIGIILAFFAGIGVGWVALKSKIQPALRSVISDLVDDVTDDIYPCRLIATIRFNQEADRTIVNMSQYADKGIIGITVDKVEAPQSEQEETLDGEPSLYPTAVVYRMGEHWLWKVL